MVNCKPAIKKELRRSHFSLNHHKPHLFVTSQWWRLEVGCSRFYIFWRVFWGIFWPILCLVSSIQNYAANDYPESEFAPWKFFIYLSNYALLVLTADVIVQASVVIYTSLKYNKVKNYALIFSGWMPWYLKLQWVLFNMSLCVGFVVTMGFFSYIERYLSEGLLPYLYIHIATHLINSLYLFSNLMLTAIPIRIYHVIHTWIPATLYTIFTGIYYYLGGTNMYGERYIYWLYDWSTPEYTGPVCVMLMLLGVLGMWGLIYLMYRVRLLIHRARTRHKARRSQRVGYRYPYVTSYPVGMRYDVTNHPVNTGYDVTHHPVNTGNDVTNHPVNTGYDVSGYHMGTWYGSRPATYGYPPYSRRYSTTYGYPPIYP